MLYPSRASAPKNQMRWQFGVLAPRAYAAASPGERWTTRTECVVDPGQLPRLTVRVRCLQVQRRTISAFTPGIGFAEAAELDVDGEHYLTWEEAVEHEFDIVDVPLMPPSEAEPRCRSGSADPNGGRAAIRRR